MGRKLEDKTTEQETHVNQRKEYFHNSYGIIFAVVLISVFLVYMTYFVTFGDVCNVIVTNNTEEEKRKIIRHENRERGEKIGELLNKALLMQHKL